MFGPPSLPKILVLALIVALVWGAFVLIGRLQQARRDEEKRAVRRTKAAKVARVQDMVLCPACGAYHPAGAPHECARSRARG